MTLKQTDILSEHQVHQQAEDYDRWFSEQVQQALDDPRPALPHDEAMAKLEAMLKEKRTLRARRAAG